MRILLAEDDQAFRMTLSGLLKDLGHTTVEVRDGAEAWTSFSESPFPLVLSDLTMPEVDGLELCRRIRAKDWKQYCYFILITARTGKENYNEAIRAGVDDFIPKPLKEDDLITRLHVAERILAWSRTIHQLQSLLPTCCHCGRIRDEQERWMNVEDYIQSHTGSEFTHGVCSDCMKKHYPDLAGPK